MKLLPKRARWVRSQEGPDNPTTGVPLTIAPCPKNDPKCASEPVKVASGFVESFHPLAGFTQRKAAPLGSKVVTADHVRHATELASTQSREPAVVLINRRDTPGRKLKLQSRPKAPSA